jgi:hypothetical protein
MRCRPAAAALAALTLLAALPAAAQAPRAVVRMRPFTRPIVLDSMTLAEEHAAPAGEAFRAAEAALTAFRIPVTTRDSAAGLLANLKLVRNGTLAGVPLSQYLNCGQGLTGQYADVHRVTLVVAAFVDPLPGNRSRVGFALSGAAIDMAGHSVDPNACESLGTLESRLGSAVRDRLLARRPAGP